MGSSQSRREQVEVSRSPSPRPEPMPQLILIRQDFMCHVRDHYAQGRQTSCGSSGAASSHYYSASKTMITEPKLPITSGYNDPVPFCRNASNNQITQIPPSAPVETKIKSGKGKHTIAVVAAEKQTSYEFSCPNCRKKWFASAKSAKQGRECHKCKTLVFPKEKTFLKM